MNSKKSFSKKSNSFSNKMSRTVSSGEELTVPEHDQEELTPILVMSVCDLPEIYTHLAYTVYKNELISNSEHLRSILEHLSFINIKSKDIVDEFCDVLKTKNIGDLDEFIKRSSKNPSVARKTSVFRFDPSVILSMFLNHDNHEQATCFMRYIMHSAHLPADMNSFLEEYKNANFVMRDAMIPKVIYSWIDIQ